MSESANIKLPSFIKEQLKILSPNILLKLLVYITGGMSSFFEYLDYSQQDFESYLQQAINFCKKYQNAKIKGM